MRGRFIKLFVFVSVFCLFIPCLKAENELPFPDPEADITMEFEGADLYNVLKAFSVQSGLNFIASEAVKERKITLYMDKVPIKEAMDKLFKANNLSYDLDENSNIFIVKDLGVPQTETVTKVFYLKYATVSSSSIKEEMSKQMSGDTSTSSSSSTSGKWKSEDTAGITEAVKKLLSSNGMVVEDYRTNSLIVTDIPSRMPVIAQTIALLDISIPQVLIEVEMLDVSKNVVDKMGFDHGNNPFTFVFYGDRAKAGTGSVDGSGGFIGNTVLRGGSMFPPSSAAGAILFGRTFGQTLDFLRTQTDTKYLARPRLLTLNNETAEIKITTQESVGVKTTASSTGSTQAEPERAETGVSLRVTPQINADTGEITMFIYPQVSEAVQGSAITSGALAFQYRDPEVRSTKSIVKVMDGDTVILGGLIRNEFSQVKSKIPILGDIPILGALFRHKGGTSDKNKERELLVFITPHIVKDKFIRISSGSGATLPLREQGAVSTLDRQLAISTRLNTFEKTK